MSTATLSIKETSLRTRLGSWARRNLRIGRGRDLPLVGWMLIALLASFFAYIARMHEITHDAFHEMSLVREALATGKFPVDDVFAYTPTVNPAVHHEWATGAVLYFATIGSGLGVYGLSILRLLVAAGIWLMLYRVARMRGAHPYVFGLFSFVVFPVLWVGFATLRAQAFTLLFIAIQLWMQEQDQRGRRSWIVLWLIMLVAWLNLHAGFVVGAGMIAIHTLERFFSAWFREGHLWGAIHRVWHLIAAAPLAILALGLNPYGWDYPPYLLRAIAMPRPLVIEWLPLWHTYSPVITLILFAASVGLFVYAQRHGAGSRWRGAAFLALAAYMALKHIRHGSIYAVIWIAYVPAWLSRTSLGRSMVRLLESNRRVSIRGCQLVTIGCLTFCVAHHIWLPTMPSQRLYSTACYPTGAIQYLKDHDFRGNLLTPFHVGAYVSWEMHPQVKVSLDGRYEVAYQEQIMPEHNHFFEGGEQWWSILEKYPTDAALVHIQAPVVQRFDELTADNDQLPDFLKSWRVVYQDRSFAIIAPEGTGLEPVDNRAGSLVDGARSAFDVRRSHWFYLADGSQTSR